MADQPSPDEATDAPDTKGANKKERRPLRRILFIAGALFAVFIVYAFAFNTTDVSLEEIQSETRQEQLFRILRALVHPDLVTYDTEDSIVSADVYIPCQPGVEAEQPTGEPRINVTPSCASPREILTVTGTGYEPEQLVSLHFIPDSEFDITLTLGRVRADDSGMFTLEFEAPERESENPQQVIATVAVNIGGWTNRIEVWTDTNFNGVQDSRSITAEQGPIGYVAIPLPEVNVRSPGGVTLNDENGNVLEFLSWGGSFEATTGNAKGLTSTDIGFDPTNAPARGSVQLTGQASDPGDFTWTEAGESYGAVNDGQLADAGLRRSGVFFNELSFGADNVFELAGPDGESLERMAVIFFDGEDGSQYRTVVVTDLVELSPRLSETATLTFDKIVETVMLALLATTVGLILAVPLSFTSARNLMRDVMVPVINLALIVLGIPIGVVAGVQAARWARWLLIDRLDSNTLVMAVLFVLLPLLMWWALRWAFPADTEGKGTAFKVVRTIVLIGVGFVFVIFGYVVALLLMWFGDWLAPKFGPFTFIGDFFFTLGEIQAVIIPLLAAMFGLGVLAMLGSKLGYFLDGHLTRGTMRVLTFPVAALAGITVALAIMAVIDWFFQIDNRIWTQLVPALVGGTIGLLLAARALRKESVNIGMIIYYASRTTFNILRSIEPLVMVIVFVVWVGVGPFAGALALALHTTAALSKLYSEQVESISLGPLEAVRATGATRLQTIVYAVAPQIVPPYISFTMYRWDINVRMSTIIGFAGGGGIGFLLQQNINLLQYRAAAAQMLAIAIVVATMDYISARLRERFV